MIRYKKTVKLSRLQPELLAGLMVCDQVYDKMFGRDMWVTSVNDSRHGWGSLHFVGQAADIRAKDLKRAEADRLRDAIADRICNEFDVIVEWDREVQANCHLHIEWQPKK